MSKSEHRVDFLRRTVRIDRPLVRLPGQPTTFGPPKTAASVRTIPLPRVVVDALAAHLTAFPAGPDGFIFTNKTGQPLTRSSFFAGPSVRLGLSCRHRPRTP